MHIKQYFFLLSNLWITVTSEQRLSMFLRINSVVITRSADIFTMRSRCKVTVRRDRREEKKLRERITSFFEIDKMND